MEDKEAFFQRKREFYNSLNNMYNEFNKNKIEISSEEEIDEWFRNL